MIKNGWKEGVEDSIRIVEYRRRTLLALCSGVETRADPAAVAMLDEIHTFLSGMLARGERAMRSTTDTV